MGLLFQSFYNSVKAENSRKRNCHCLLQLSLFPMVLPPYHLPWKTDLMVIIPFSIGQGTIGNILKCYKENYKYMLIAKINANTTQNISVAYNKYFYFTWGLWDGFSSSGLYPLSCHFRTHSKEAVTSRYTLFSWWRA